MQSTRQRQKEIYIFSVVTGTLHGIRTPSGRQLNAEPYAMDMTRGLYTWSALLLFVLAVGGISDVMGWARWWFGGALKEEKEMARPGIEPRTSPIHEGRSTTELPSQIVEESCSFALRSVILERFEFLTNLPQDLYSYLCTEEYCELGIWHSNTICSRVWSSRA